jgi:hypothetical protein
VRDEGVMARGGGGAVAWGVDWGVYWCCAGVALWRGGRRKRGETVEGEQQVREILK